jgi:hypothetical protein
MARPIDKIPKHLLPRLPVCVLRLLSAERGEIAGRDPIDWAIDSDIKGEDREILREALALMIEKSPVLAHIKGKAHPDDPEPEWPEQLDFLSQVWLDKLLRDDGD